MAVTEKEYNSIIEYVYEYLNKTYEVNKEILAVDIVSLPGQCDYTDWKESIKGKKKKEKIVYTESWKKWWNTWPSTKSVPDTEYTSGAKMKGAEEKMHDKWYNAISSGKITEEKMQYAAECYLLWAYEDSKRLGRNELHYRNGMEPWLNQDSYLIYMDRPLPTIKNIEKLVSGDINI